MANMIKETQESIQMTSLHTTSRLHNPQLDHLLKKLFPLSSEGGTSSQGNTANPEPNSPQSNQPMLSPKSQQFFRQYPPYMQRQQRSS